MKVLGERSIYLEKREIIGGNRTAFAYAGLRGTQMLHTPEVVVGRLCPPNTPLDRVTWR